MDNKILLKKIKSGIDSYKKVFPKKYQFIKNFVDPAILAITIAKIESNFNHKARGKAGEYGLYQFMPATLTATIRSYTKNVTASKRLFYLYPNSQTFVFMQLLYLNLKGLNRKGGKLNPAYENLIKTLPIGERNLLRAAILHNQGASALTRQATRYNPLVFYAPQFLGAVRILKQPPTKNIEFVALALPFIWEGAVALTAAAKLAAVGIVSYIGYKTVLKVQSQQIVDATKPAYREALRIKMLELELDRLGPPQGGPGTGENNKPSNDKVPDKKPPQGKPPKKDIPWVKIGVGTGAATAGTGVAVGTANAMDNLSKSAGKTLEDLPDKFSDLLKSPMFLGAAIGIFYLISKKK